MGRPAGWVRFLNQNSKFNNQQSGVLRASVLSENIAQFRTLSSQTEQRIFHFAPPLPA